MYSLRAPSARPVVSLSLPVSEPARARVAELGHIKIKGGSAPPLSGALRPAATRRSAPPPRGAPPAAMARFAPRSCLRPVCAGAPKHEHHPSCSGGASPLRDRSCRRRQEVEQCCRSPLLRRRARPARYLRPDTDISQPPCPPVRPARDPAGMGYLWGGGAEDRGGDLRIAPGRVLGGRTGLQTVRSAHHGVERRPRWPPSQGAEECASCSLLIRELVAQVPAPCGDHGKN
jgi:hypothetical protein